MSEIFFLSVMAPYAALILSGKKKWELRANPRFGIFPDCEMGSGDRVYIVSMGDHPVISCLATVTRILRGEAYRDYFGDFDTGHWQETGCGTDPDRDLAFFRNEIFEEYTTAIGLLSCPLVPAIEVCRIRHRFKQKPWNGRGCVPLAHLKRFEIDGKPVPDYFHELADRLLSVRDARVSPGAEPPG